MPNQRLYQLPGTPRVMNGSFSSDEDTTYGPASVSFGADAAIGNKQRELALAGLDAAMQDTRKAAEPDFLKQQRANIAAHGTIETPQDFTYRTGQRDAADLMNPANPMGRLRADDERAGLAKVHESNVRPAEIAAAVNREKIASDFDASVLGADSAAEAARYKADTDAQATLEKELTSQYLWSDKTATPATRDQALQGLLQALRNPQIARRFRQPASVGR